MVISFKDDFTELPRPINTPKRRLYAREIGVAVDDDGFLKSRNNVDAITESSRPGVFFAGSCTGAKTVPETLAEARSAALAIHQYLNKPR